MANFIYVPIVIPYPLFDPGPGPSVAFPHGRCCCRLARTHAALGSRPAMEPDTPWERRRSLLNCSVLQLVEDHRCLTLTDPHMLDWLSRLSALDRMIIDYDGGLTQFLRKHPALEVCDNSVYLSENQGIMRNSQYFIPPTNNVSLVSEAKGHGSGHGNMLHWLPSRAEEHTVTQPSYNTGRNVPQQHLQDGIFRPGEPFHLNRTLTQKPEQRMLIKGASLHETNSSGCSAAENQGPRTFIWNEFVPTLSKTATTEDDAPAANIDQASVLLTSEDQNTSCHSLMEEDGSIVSYIKKRNRKIPSITPEIKWPEPSSESSKSQYQVAVESSSSSSVPCDTNGAVAAAALLPQCTSRFIQRDDLEKSDKNVNTELHMADLDFITEDFIQMAKKELGDKQEKMSRTRDKHLAQVALSVDSERKTTGDIPGQIIDVQANVPSRTCQEQHKKMDETNGSLHKQSGQGRDSISNPGKQEENQTSACKELSTSEVWYDAVATMDSADAAVMGPDKDQTTTLANKEDNKEAKSLVLDARLVPKTKLPSSMSSSYEVSHSPTARGTFVPQHYGTMEFMATLMTELKRRHPGVKRQKIVEALIELKGKEPLIRLSLSTITDMMSQLLSRPADATQP